MLDSAEDAPIFEEENASVVAAYNYACMRNSGLRDLPKDQLEQFIHELIREVAAFDHAAHQNSRGIVPKYIAEKIGAIWVFSGPGTYENATKDDRYAQYPWARWMDRDRLAYAALIARKISEAKGVQDVTGRGLGTLAVHKAETKHLIALHGPQIIYNGTVLENASVRSVLEKERADGMRPHTGVIIPSEKVMILPDPVRNTTEQVSTFCLPSDFTSSQELVLVSHAPQLPRILRTLQRYRPFPAGTRIRLFPLPTPAAAGNEYFNIEVSGTLFYCLLDRDSDGQPIIAREPYPYKVGIEL